MRKDYNYVVPCTLRCCAKNLKKDFLNCDEAFKFAIANNLIDFTVTNIKQQEIRACQGTVYTPFRAIFTKHIIDVICCWKLVKKQKEVVFCNDGLILADKDEYDIVFHPKSKKILQTNVIFYQPGLYGTVRFEFPTSLKALS